MRFAKLLAASACLAVGSAVGLALAQSQPDAGPAQEGIVVPTVVQPKEVRQYKVLVQTSGRMPAEGGSEAIDLSQSFELKLQHKYGVRDPDGLLTLEVSVVEGRITTGDQSLVVDSTTFPKLTVLLDRNWRVSAVFGVTSGRYQKSMPGLNYVNLLLLYYLYGGDKPHAVGESWTEKVKLPVYQEIYDFVNSVRSTEALEATAVAVVGQEISWTPRREDGIPASTCKAVVQSRFALSDGKLLKSRAECDIVFLRSTSTDRQEPVAERANIKIDIALIR